MGTATGIGVGSVEDDRSRRLFRRRVGGIVAGPVEPWLDDEEPEYLPGVHQITVLAEGATLASPIHYIRESYLAVAGVAEPYPPGQMLMLGGDGWDTFEIVQVIQDTEGRRAPSRNEKRRGVSAVAESHPTGTGVTPAVMCRVRRGLVGTVGGPHSAGTPVTPVTIGEPSSDAGSPEPI